MLAEVVFNVEGEETSVVAAEIAVLLDGSLEYAHHLLGSGLGGHLLLQLAKPVDAVLHEGALEA